MDYGVGNTGSLSSFLELCGFRAETWGRHEPEVDILILPGVGSARTAMANLARLNLVESIRNEIGRGMPLVGVCLGAQLLLDSSEEDNTETLGLVSGKSVSLAKEGKPINTGWNEIDQAENTGFGELTKLESQNGFLYFNHGFAMQISDPEVETIHTVGNGILAMFRKGNLVGMQFHPEKSQILGKLVFQSVIEGLLGRI